VRRWPTAAERQPLAAKADLSTTKPLVEELPVAPKPREFVDITPAALITLRRQPNLTAIQAERVLAPYVGKWLKITGGVHDVSQNILWLNVPAKPPNPSYNVAATALDERNRQSFSLMEQREITIIGRIGRVEYSNVALDSCELVPVLDFL